MQSPNRLSVSKFARLIGMSEEDLERRINLPKTHQDSFNVYYIKGKRLEGRQPFRNTAIMKREARTIVRRLVKHGEMDRMKGDKLIDEALKDVPYERGQPKAKAAKNSVAKEINPQPVKGQGPAQFTVTLDQQVINGFLRTCREHGLVHEWVLAGLMRRFIESPDKESKFIRKHFGGVPEWLDN